MSHIGKRVKISITGDLGSGKSTICRYLKEKYGLSIYSIGQIQRSLAQKYNMDVLAFNKYMESHPEIDEEIDAELIRIGERDEDMVLDSRMAWHFVPETFKVYLTVTLEEAASRIMKDQQRGTVECYSSPEEARISLIKRKESENLRYRTKYGVDCANLNNFDFVLDATCLSPEEAGEKILTAAKSHLGIGIS